MLSELFFVCANALQDFIAEPMPLEWEALNDSFYALWDELERLDPGQNWLPEVVEDLSDWIGRAEENGFVPAGGTLIANRLVGAGAEAMPRAAA